MWSTRRPLRRRISCTEFVIKESNKASRQEEQDAYDPHKYGIRLFRPENIDGKTLNNSFHLDRLKKCDGAPYGE